MSTKSESFYIAHYDPRIVRVEGKHLLFSSISGNPVLFFNYEDACSVVYDNELAFRVSGKTKEYNVLTMPQLHESLEEHLTSDEWSPSDDEDDGGICVSIEVELKRDPESQMRKDNVFRCFLNACCGNEPPRTIHLHREVIRSLATSQDEVVRDADWVWEDDTTSAEAVGCSE